MAIGFELQQLRQAVALAEHGSFMRASAALRISQPAMSRSIQNLERSFGSELFVRSSSGVVPTDVGRVYIERARDLLRLADDLAQGAVRHAALKSGRVAVGAGPFPAESFLGSAAARFIEQFPRVDVHVRMRQWDELLAELRSRELDLFVAETSTLHRDPDLEVEPMSSAHVLYFFARAEHPLAGTSNATVADIARWPFVTPSRIPPRILDPWLTAYQAATRGVSSAIPFPSIHCNGLAPVKRIVGSSDAISCSILSCIATELESGRFVLLGTAPWLHLHYGVVSLRGRPSTQPAERFRQFIRDAEAQVAVEEKQLASRYLTAHPRRRRVRGRAGDSRARPR